MSRYPIQKRVWSKPGFMLVTIALLVLGLSATAFAERTPAFCNEASPNKTNSDWMKNLSDDELLSKLSIPGTHDSGTYPGKGGRLAQCQTWDITEQLNAGVRYLDVRCVETDGSFAIHHGAFFQDIMFGTS